MADIVSAETRSKIMRAVPRQDTAPELEVRRVLRSLRVGYRVRNHDLPGSPDIANRRGRWAVFVNGCFWHGHRTCRRARRGGPQIPSSNTEFWREKIAANRLRDARKCRELRRLGFRVAIVWECELVAREELRDRLAGFLRLHDLR